MAKLYAVKKGITPGIYNSWNECENQTKGFPGAEFKSFKQREDAEQFMVEGLKMNKTDEKDTTTNTNEIDYSKSNPEKQGIYAVRKGTVPGIYNTWSQCQEQIQGVKGAQYKSFKKMEDADQFMIDGPDAKPVAQTETQSEPKSDVYVKRDEEARALSHEPNTVSVYTDGSCGTDPDGNKNYTGGFVVIKDGEIVARECTYGDQPELAQLNNVAGEMQAAMHGINHVKKNMPEDTNINMFVDYTGLMNWTKTEEDDGKRWKSKNEWTQKYTKYIDDSRDTHNINFEHVKGHIADPYNEEADTLATYSKLINEENREFDLDEFMTNHSFIGNTDLSANDKPKTTESERFNGYKTAPKTTTSKAPVEPVVPVQDLGELQA